MNGRAGSRARNRDGGGGSNRPNSISFLLSGPLPTKPIDLPLPIDSVFVDNRQTNHKAQVVGWKRTKGGRESEFYLRNGTFVKVKTKLNRSNRFRLFAEMSKIPRLLAPLDNLMKRRF